MNVYDFDGTLYKGDSTIDFWLYCLKKHPSLLRFIPWQLSGLLLYAVHLLDKKGFKQCFYSFLQGVTNIPSLAENFWKLNMGKIAKWYADKHRPDDVVISASPEFLLRPICTRLGISYLIASGVDSQTGMCTTANCEKEEKVQRFHKEFGDAAYIENFFSDSSKDAPLARLADKAFLVKGEYIKNFF